MKYKWTSRVFGVFFVVLALASLAAACGNERESNRPVPLPDGEESVGQCNDGVQNGAETDVDCGGGECPRCEQNRMCEESSDCTTRICDRGRCVDDQCRGRDCLAGQACYRGDCFRSCREQEDCPGAEERCVGGACVPTDCEGVSCDEETEGCYLGGCYTTCETSRDCRGAGEQCLFGYCIAPSCSDGIQTGDETDVDCGGSLCEPCRAGGQCLQDSDCLQDASSWSACEFTDGDICANAGTQEREVSSLECSSDNICVGETEVETRACTRETDGLQCGSSTPGSWGPCQADPNGGECSTTGIQYRDVLEDQCQSGSCQSVSAQESRSCDLDPSGQPCSTSLSCASDGVCTADGSCAVQGVSFGNCAIDGQCWSSGAQNPEFGCKRCLPDIYQDRWSYIYCTDTSTSTDCGGGAVSCEIPGYWQWNVFQLGAERTVPFEDSTGINISTQNFQNCSSILDVYMEMRIGGYAGKGELEVNLLTPWGGSYRVLERGDISGISIFEVSYPPPNHVETGRTFLDRNGEGVWTVNFNNTGTRLALENLIVEALVLEVWCEL